MTAMTSTCRTLKFPRDPRRSPLRLAGPSWLEMLFYHHLHEPLIEIPACFVLFVFQAPSTLTLFYSLFFCALFSRFYPGWQGVSTDFCIAHFAYGFGLFFLFLRYGHGHRQWRLINTERSFLFYQPLVSVSFFFLKWYASSLGHLVRSSRSSTIQARLFSGFPFLGLVLGYDWDVTMAWGIQEICILCIIWTRMNPRPLATFSETRVLLCMCMLYYSPEEFRVKVPF